MTAIVHLRHASVDKNRWDRTIAQSMNGMVYAQSWFLDLVSPGWEALVVGDYESVMPLTWRKKGGIRYLFQPPFTQQLGVFSLAPVSSVFLAQFLDAIPVEFKYVDVFLNAGNPAPLPETTPLLGRFLPRITHHLPLVKDSSLRTVNYSENLRRNLKKAAGFDGSPERVTIKELIRLFRANRGRSVATLGAREYALLEKIAEEASRRGLLTLTGIRSGAKLLAGACFLESNRESIFFFSAVGEEGKKSGAMSAVIDRHIRSYDGPALVLDFEGSMDKNLSRYYKSFGAHEIVYLHFQSNRLPRLLRWLKK